MLTQMREGFPRMKRKRAVGYLCEPLDDGMKRKRAAGCLSEDYPLDLVRAAVRSGTLINASRLIRAARANIKKTRALQIAKALQSENFEIETPYGPLVDTLDISIAEDSKEPIYMEYVNPFALLHVFASSSIKAFRFVAFWIKTSRGKLSYTWMKPDQGMSIALILQGVLYQ